MLWAPFTSIQNRSEIRNTKLQSPKADRNPTIFLLGPLPIVTETGGLGIVPGRLIHLDFLGKPSKGISFGSSLLEALCFLMTAAVWWQVLNHFYAVSYLCCSIKGRNKPFSSVSFQLIAKAIIPVMASLKHTPGLVLGIIKWRLRCDQNLCSHFYHISSFHRYKWKPKVVTQGVNWCATLQTG